MANAYTQLTVQLILVIKHRRATIHFAWEAKLYEYLGGFLRNTGHKVLAINGMPDHVHILMGLNPAIAISDMVRELKKASTAYVNQQKFTSVPFQWQPGYAAFSYSRSERSRVIRYIERQKEHHLKASFRKEYLEMLREFEIEFKEEYLFEFL